MKAWRLVALAFAACGIAWIVPVSFGLISPAEPFDRVVDVLIEEVPHDPALDCTTSRERTLVVLQHGLVRSPTSLWPLERALVRHGYEVLNPAYPSLTRSIDEQAVMLDEAIDAHFAARRAAGAPGPESTRIAFVGHSMGGLVIRAYLERDDAVDAWACIFCGTPHRGARMAEVRKQWLVFRLFFGRGAAAEQLLPDASLYGRLGPVEAARIGTIRGERGDGRGYAEQIPGEDDRMVGADEAQLAEQDESIALFMMHTWLAISPPAVHQVLSFLRHGRFDRVARRTW